MKSLFPTRTIALFMAIGFIDMATTAVLHAQGRIIELNPIMRFLIEQGEWLFCIGKGLTLVAGWAALAHYAKVNLPFVRRAAIWGSGAYLAVWMAWFFGAIAVHPTEPEMAPNTPPAYKSDSPDSVFV